MLYGSGGTKGWGSWVSYCCAVAFPSSVDAGGRCEATGAVEVWLEDACEGETETEAFSPVDGGSGSGFL